MTDDLAALMAAVQAAPADDLPRLVAADWLEEHGQPEWAAAIRVMCRDTDACGGWWGRVV